DVLARQQFAKLLVGRAALKLLVALDAVELLDRLAGVFSPRRVNVTDRYHLRIGHRQEVVQEPASLRARANETHGDQVIGAFPGGISAGGVEKEGGGECGGGGRFEELPPIQLVLHSFAQSWLP